MQGCEDTDLFWTFYFVLASFHITEIGWIKKNIFVSVDRKNFYKVENSLSKNWKLELRKRIFC